MELNDVQVELDGCACRLGLALFEAVEVKESPPGLLDEISQLVNDYTARGVEMPEDYVKGVRDTLRQGGFKPSGRNRPASEYLVRDLAATGEFHYVNNLVDINNLLSLRHFLPMSVVDAGKFSGEAHLRLGYEKERYVFNPSGQELDLTGLIVVADFYGGASRAMGSPIKDSQFAKLTDETASALVVVYANPRLVNELHMEQILGEWADLSRKFAGAHSAQTRIVTVE